MALALLGARALGGGLLDLAGRVRAEDAGRGELAELVPDHVLRDVDLHEHLPVVDHERVADKLGDDVAAARPRLHRLAARGAHALDALPHVGVHVRALLEAAAHRYLPTCGPRLRPRTMNRSECFLGRRVLPPLLSWPHFETGWRPPARRPSPPPMGWETGFIAEPRTSGRRPMWRLRPALPRTTRLASRLPTWPTVARQSRWMRRISVEGSVTSAYSPSRAVRTAPAPALRTSCAPPPGPSSIAWIVRPTGMWRSGRQLPGFASAAGPLATTSPGSTPSGATT